jgi:hypothetical protein
LTKVNVRPRGGPDAVRGARVAQPGAAIQPGSGARGLRLPVLTRNVVIEFWVGGKKVLEGLDLVLEDGKRRQNFFKKEKIQRRHYLIPRFISQTGKQIADTSYMKLSKNK